MTNTRVLNAKCRRPEYYWKERGFSEGFDRQTYALESGAPVDCSLPSGLSDGLKKYYQSGFRSGREYAKNLHQDLLKGDVSK